MRAAGTGWKGGRLQGGASLIWRLGVLACMLFAVSAAQAAEPEKSRAQMKPDKVRVQLKWRHQFQFAGYYAALEKGFYRDAGLDVTLIEHSPGVTPIDQLMQGVVDFAVADTGALIYRSTGVPLVALAAIFQHSPSILMTRADRGVEQLTDLRYRRLMLSGGYMNAELMAMLQNAGLNFEEINLVPSETSLDALLEGRVDAYNAYTTNEPFFMEKHGEGYRMFQPRDHGVDFYGDTLFTTEQKIAADPDLVERFRQASVKGWAYAVEHPDETVDLILADYNTQNKTREHLMFEAEQSINLILPNVVPIGYMNAERWGRIEEVFEKQGRLAQKVDLRRFIYPSDEWGQLLSIWDRHRGVIIFSGLGLIGVLLISHILSLRLQIRARTRELEAAKRKAEAEARTDELTGLPNRRHFFEGLARDVARAARKNLPVTLIVADIDHFKSVNDTYGHAAGDEALRRAGDVFSAYVRSGDMAARIGGEEFALGCLDAPLAEARELAERLRQEIESTAVQYDGQTFNITCSFGLAQGQMGQDIDQMFHAADQALYEAKRTGRNTVCA